MRRTTTHKKAAERRNTVATGVSPWVQTDTLFLAPAGRHSMHIPCYAAPSVLMFGRWVNHGLTPVAKVFRHSVANCDFLRKAAR